MPLCCIGGVCVPYTAGLPILAYCLRWIVTQLIRLLPQTWADRLGWQNKKNVEAGDKKKNGDCCGQDSNCCSGEESSTVKNDCCSNDDTAAADANVNAARRRRQSREKVQ